MDNALQLLAAGAQPAATQDAPVAAADPAWVAKATKAAVDFESFFIAHMLHQMRESARTLAPEDSPTRDRVNQDMTDMVDNMLAGKMAGQRAFGVADAILRQLVPAPLNKAG
jgi:peptidoglycan hydrolase FlgJ